MCNSNPVSLTDRFTLSTPTVNVLSLVASMVECIGDNSPMVFSDSAFKISDYQSENIECKAFTVILIDANVRTKKNVYFMCIQAHINM